MGKDGGLEISLPTDYAEYRKRAENQLETLLKPYPKAYQASKMLLEDPEVMGCWDAANVIAVKKLGYNDHGDVHAKITAANSALILKILNDKKVVPDFVTDRGGDLDDSFLIIIVSSLLHDIGNQVHRINHELHSCIIAMPILNRVLSKIYGNKQEKIAEIRAQILHCIQTHDADPQPLTLEANIVAVGDGSDMSKGRGRLPFDRGRVTIHTVSALSIKDVKIEPGPGEKVKIVVELSNSAGIHQLEKVLAPRLSTGIASRYFLVEARTIPTSGPHADERIIHTITMDGKKIVVK